ncbi:MAG: Rpn family recombination-promoting nuclease/putative transposase, partial [Crocinitomicaceae bacterium]|nr:Rpn family recombination-promoting nuclease/putative transposase [Crocinitomicaceae bacterium]
HFDKWLFVFTHLSKLQDRPKRLQEKIFQQLFEAAEIANLPKEDREAYEESLKHYMDIKNVVDTSRLEGIQEGKLEIAKTMKSEGESVEKIIKYTGLSNDEIEKL